MVLADHIQHRLPSFHLHSLERSLQRWLHFRRCLDALAIPATGGDDHLKVWGWLQLAQRKVVGLGCPTVGIHAQIGAPYSIPHAVVEDDRQRR